MTDESFWQLRFEPARWVVEKHVIKVYVGTDGLEQYHKLERDLEGMTNANCMAHARHS